MALVVVAVILVVGGTLYYVLEPRPPSVLPTIWSMPEACDRCGVAVNSNDIYRLTLVNESMYGDTNYTVGAFSLSTGAPAWPAVSVFIRQGFGQYQGTFGEIAPFFADKDTVSLVLAGSGEWTTGQSAPFDVPYPALFVLEWNATTGRFLGLQGTENTGSLLTYVSAIQEDGWILADWIPSDQYPVKNLSLATFPEQSPSPWYGAWSRNISVGALAWEGWPLFPVTMGGGLVTVSEMGGNNTTAVFNGATGAMMWQGALPMWLASGDNLDTVGYFDNVVRSGGNLDYIAENSSNGYLMSFNLFTHSVSELGAIGVSGWQLNTTTLEVEGNGDLIATDAWSNSYYCFSPAGQLLWTRQIGLTVDSEPAGGGIGSIAYQPLEMNGGYLFVTVFQDWATGSGPTGSELSFSFTVPLLILTGTTGAVFWQSSYTASFTVGNPGPSTIPTLYDPILAQGQFLIYLHGLDIAIAQFSAIPPS